MVEFVTRAKVDKRDGCTFRRWRSTTHPLAIVETAKMEPVKSRKEGTKKLKLVRRYLLVHVLETGEYILDRPRSLAAAKRDAQWHGKALGAN